MNNKIICDMIVIRFTEGRYPRKRIIVKESAFGDSVFLVGVE